MLVSNPVNTDYVHIWAGEITSCVFWWSGDAARGQQRQGAATLGGDAAAPSECRSHVVAVRQTVWTQIVLEFTFSRTCQYKE